MGEEQNIKTLLQIHTLNDETRKENMMACKYRLRENERNIATFDNTIMVTANIQSILAIKHSRAEL